ncbi:hypothetical protein [Actinoplanes sp. NPDC049599]|jgi:hypothetical protein|uniref:hypothetical protein n=1 Tax=Actinoplanes sp. NPDC049599 TaxID=3363903 RepID=UPI0037979327
MVIALGKRAVYCVALLPLALGSLLAVFAGRSPVAVRWWSRLRSGLLGGTAPAPVPPPGPLVVAGHALLTVLLGLTALIPLGLILAFVVRGVCYGLVDPGPYDHSWGGPSRAGAWAAHFLIGLPIAVVALLLLAGLAAVHDRLSGLLAGRRPARWVLPVSLTAPLPAVLFFVAWLHQL